MTPENEKALRAASTLISEAIPSDQLCNSIAAHIRRLVAEVERLKTPLTDEQIDSLLIEHDMMCEWPTQRQVRNFASAIEQAHVIGEKT